MGNPGAIRAYLSDFTYRFGEPERRGLARFGQLVAEETLDRLEDLTP